MASTDRQKRRDKRRTERKATRAKRGKAARSFVEGLNPFDSESAEKRRRAKERRIELRQSGRTARTTARTDVRKTRVEAKGASGYWTPEAVEARQTAWSSVAQTGLQVAGDVASQYLGGSGSSSSTEAGDDTTSSSSSSSSSSSTMLLVGAAVLGGFLLFGGRKGKG